MRFNERFGQGTASYTEVRDRMTGDEVAGWMAYFAAWDEREAVRKAQSEHDKTMEAARSALARRH